MNPYKFNNNLVLKNIGVSKYVLGYDKYIFECNNIDENYIYIVYSNNEIVDNLIDSRFKYSNFGEYYLLYN